jgi:hypothetical protein
MKSAFKRILQTLAPRFTSTVQAIRARRHLARLNEQWGQVELSRQFAASHGDVVSDGPFRGLKLPFDPNYTMYIPMLIGSLEMELHAAVEHAVTRQPRTIVNVGCAEGYYAIGFLRRLSHARSIAFDIDPWARKFCRRLGQVNDVADRVSLRGWCDPVSLARALEHSGLVICDCEGYELELLNPDACPALRRADILVELHDFARRGGVSVPILRRFAESHEIEQIPIRGRNPDDFPALHVLPVEKRAAAVAELRNPESSWAWLVAKRR